MKTVGEILAQERKKQGKTLAQISQQTKIPLSALKSLEEDSYDTLPSTPFVRGFIRNYAQELGLAPAKILAIFRRDHQQVEQKNRILPKGMAKNLNQSFSWTPKTTIILSVVLVLTVIVGFLFLEVRNYLFAPYLDIFSPKDGDRIWQLVVEVKGKTIPDAIVSVNDQLAILEFDGSFSYKLELLPGENLIRVKAVNRRGKEKEVKLGVVVDKQ